MKMGWGSQAFSQMSKKLVILREMLFLCCQMLGSRTNEYLWPWPEIHLKFKVFPSPHPRVLFIGLFIHLLRPKDEAGLERDQRAPRMLQLCIHWPPWDLLFLCLLAFLRVCTRLTWIGKWSLEPGRAVLTANMRAWADEPALEALPNTTGQRSPKS